MLSIPLIDMRVAQAVTDMDAITDACDDSCVDPRCWFFFIHGERKGNPTGIGEALDA